MGSAPAAGTTRYWVALPLFGPDAELGALVTGERNTVYGRLTDNLEKLEPTWTIYT